MKPKIVYEHTAPEEIEGAIDGMDDELGDDVGLSDYDLDAEPWPGVPEIPLPEPYVFREPPPAPTEAT